MEKLDASWLNWPETQALLAAIPDLRFVGGCVRDTLLGREVRDIDAATPQAPDAVMALLAKAGIKAIPTGIDHGTVTARVGERHFEVTTLRRDVSTDGRHATVAYTQDWRADAARRDFTMNALYCDAEGRIYDYFGGAEDAQRGIVRFIGDAAARIAEDYLRVLRFFRFFASHGSDPVDMEGLAACGTASSKLGALSGERIRQEMLKLLPAPRAADTIVLMQQCNVWNYVVPHRVGVHTLRRLPEILQKTGYAPDPFLALALLLRNSKESADMLMAVIDAVGERWKLSKAQARHLRALYEARIPAGTLGNKPTVKRRIRALGREAFIEQIVLSLAEGMDEAHGLATIAFAREWEVPEFPVTGDDLIARGFTPGKEMGALLARLEAEWEKSEYTADREELLEAVNSQK